MAYLAGAAYASRFAGIYPAKTKAKTVPCRAEKNYASVVS